MVIVPLTPRHAGFAGDIVRDFFAADLFREAFVWARGRRELDVVRDMLLRDHSFVPTHGEGNAVMRRSYVLPERPATSWATQAEYAGVEVEAILQWVFFHDFGGAPWSLDYLPRMFATDRLRHDVLLQEAA